MVVSRSLLVCSLTLAVVVAACAKAEGPSHLHAADLQPPENAPEFNPDQIITLEELSDGSTVTPETLRAFLSYRNYDKSLKNPYGRVSFLASYYSNGLSAVDALANAGEQYRINPLVLLVRAEMDQGLVALESYPVDNPARVEYVFRCGCAGPDQCDAAFAGFDRQVDCLARQYRIILNDMDAAGGVTAGGWGKGREAKTLDAKFVTPADDGTAVAYQFDPRVGDQKSGNQLFWTIWQNYVKSVAYRPSDNPQAGGAWIGDPCVRNDQCKAVGQGAVCITSYPGGMCSAQCRASATGAGDDCPQQENRAPSRCINTGEQGQGAYCFRRCNPNAASCRGGSAEWACCAAAIFPPVTNDGKLLTDNVCLTVAPGTSCK